MEGKKDTESTKNDDDETTTPKVNRSTAQAESPKRSPLKGPSSRENTRVRTADPSETATSEVPVQKKVSDTPVSNVPSKDKPPSTQRSEAGQAPEGASAPKSEPATLSAQRSEAPISSAVQIPDPVPVVQISEAPVVSPQKSEVPGYGGPLSEQPVPSKRSLAPSTKVKSDSSKVSTIIEKSKAEPEGVEEVTAEMAPKKRGLARPEGATGFVTCLASGFPSLENFSCSKFIGKRSPFVHNPPRPEERRPRIERPRTPRDYIVNLREDLADFQEQHGLPRSRDYSFMSLGLALAQETARAICSVFLMFSELFPVIAIISLVLRFALDKLIDILETSEPIPKLKKTLIFCLQMVMILIPLWILIGTIVLPLAGLLFSIFRKLIRFKGGKSGRSCSQPKKQAPAAAALKKIEPPKAKTTTCPNDTG